MANQIPVVAILLIVQGSLECLMGLLVGLAGLFFPSMIGWMNQVMRQQPPPPRGGPVPQMPDELGWLFMAIYIVIGSLTLGAGVFRILAGISNLRYRRRVFGIVALFVGLVPMITCYCAPTSLALLIYGIIVYFNDQSARAFRLGDQGMSSLEITDRLAGTSGREPRDRIDLDS